MNENEILVTEEVTENVETETTEEITGEQVVEETTPETPAPKMFTQDEVNEIVGKSKARERAKVTKQFEKQYGRLWDVLKTGTGNDSIEEVTDTFKKHYEDRGVKFSEEPQYSARDIDVLAKAEAEEIIQGGLDEVVEEVDRLVAKGVNNMTPREKATFKVLAEYRQNAERSRELSKIGVTEDVYNSQEFRDFAGQFNSKTPIKDIYEIYAKTKPKKEYTTMGSMKQVQDKGVKDYYSPEEIERLTEEDLDNPKVWEAVRRSMTGR